MIYIPYCAVGGLVRRRKADSHRQHRVISSQQVSIYPCLRNWGLELFVLDLLTCIISIDTSKTLVIGAVLQAVAYAVQSAAPPFPAFAAIYVLTGFGVSLQVRTPSSLHRLH